MLSKGCPIIGDKLYSKGRNFSKNIENKKILFIKSFERQALHAFKISFYHPISKKKLKFKATKPEELAKLEEVLFET